MTVRFHSQGRATQKGVWCKRDKEKKTERERGRETKRERERETDTKTYTYIYLHTPKSSRVSFSCTLEVSNAIAMLGIRDHVP